MLAWYSNLVKIIVRILLIASLLQAALIYLPMPLWVLWLAHLVALETSLLGALLGLGALILGRGRLIRILAAIGMIAGTYPGLVMVPLYVREGQSFSLAAWVTGRVARDTPQVVQQRDVLLANGLRADLYRAPGAGLHPFVMVVHGGSWRSGDKGDAQHVSRTLASRGISVIDVQYRLAPGHRFPAAIQDVKCLLGTVRARAAELGLDPARGALLGRSAGAQIALVTAYSDATIASSCPLEMPPLPLRAVVSVYGPTDLAWGHDNPIWLDVVHGTDSLERYLGGPPQSIPETYRRATPQWWVNNNNNNVPATLLIHGTAEQCVRPDNAEKLQRALATHHHSVRMLLVPMADHGFDVRPGGFGEQLARGVIVDFLGAQLR